MKCTTSTLVRAAVLATMLALGASPAAAQYKKKNLVADEIGRAVHKDPHLINGWGLAFFPHGPFWVADNITGFSTVYGPHGQPIPLVVTIPVAPSQPFGPVGSPTGMVANSTSDFVISKNGKSGPALFIFDTGDGTISGWNPDVDPTNAVIVIDNSTNSPFPASYTGLAIGRNSRGQNVIYAGDFGNGLGASNNEIDMFDGSFNFLGSFTDPDQPPGMFVYGVQNVNGKLFVAFADCCTEYNGGAIDIFDTDGNLLRRFAANSSEGPLQAPWGVVLAPRDFGVFSNRVLVGNVQGGRINAFDQKTGAFLGQMQDVHGKPIEIEGLWALAFGADKHANGKPNELFFTAGPAFPPHAAEYADGLFGVITATDDHDDSPSEP
jgi:uncharacterized protein (TIGR03118 family)